MILLALYCGVLPCFLWRWHLKSKEASTAARSLQPAREGMEWCGTVAALLLPTAAAAGCRLFVGCLREVAAVVCVIDQSVCVRLMLFVAGCTFSYRFLTLNFGCFFVFVHPSDFSLPTGHKRLKPKKTGHMSRVESRF